MAICVQTRCSDCGCVVDQVLHVDDGEVRCPDCSRNVPNLDREEFKAVERTQKSQQLMGVLSVLALAAVPVLMVLWMGFLTNVKSWISTDDKAVVRDDTTLYLAVAGVCILLAMIFGALASRKRYVVDF
jgi:hypothetical protein